MGRIGRAGSSVMAARRRADRAGVDVSAPGMGILGVLERGGPQRVSVVARRAGMVGAAGQPGAAPARRRRASSPGAPTGPTAARWSWRSRPRAATRTAGCGRRRWRRRPTRWPSWKASELTELARLLARMADDFSAARAPRTVSDDVVDGSRSSPGSVPGIGRSTALALAREGCDVVVAARRADYLDEVVARARGARASHALAVPTDTGDVAQCRALVERAVEHFGRLDVVVSSAAKGTPNHTIMHADLDDWEQAWLVNVLGPLELFRAAVPHLAAAAPDGRRDRRGVGAGRAGDQPGPGCVRRDQGARSPSPRRRWRARWASTGSASTSCVPGLRARSQHRRDVRPAWPSGGTPRSRRCRSRSRPTPRCGACPTPDDIADAIVFLASDRARSITGQTLDVNGGRWFS